jgi:hypothetical protein
MIRARPVFRLLLVLAATTVVSCDSSGGEPVFTDLRIYSHPYVDVDWVNDLRLMTQHHDHLAGRPARVQAYDAAGYDALSLMDYSGNPSLAHALKERMWPPAQWVPQTVLSGLTSIRFFIPNAEEIGLEQHATSPFLTTYIETGAGSSQIANTYRSMPEMFALVRTLGGFPCVAHPWSFEYDDLEGAFCAEVYTAYVEAQKRLGRPDFVSGDRNRDMLQKWDNALRRNQRIVGIAVNDHYGPYATEMDADVRDSGKIEVLASAATVEAYRAAFEAGAVLAIRDMGAVKGQYPQILSITVDQDTAHIETGGSVTWIANGRVLQTSPTLANDDLPANARYVRAEIQGNDGSVVYTQAFVVRPVGDADGDYDIDENDDAICDAVADGSETDTERMLACEAAD